MAFYGLAFFLWSFDLLRSEVIIATGRGIKTQMVVMINTCGNKNICDGFCGWSIPMVEIAAKPVELADARYSEIEMLPRFHTLSCECLGAPQFHQLVCRGSIYTIWSTPWWECLPSHVYTSLFNHCLSGIRVVVRHLGKCLQSSDAGWLMLISLADLQLALWEWAISRIAPKGTCTNLLLGEPLVDSHQFGREFSWSPLSQWLNFNSEPRSTRIRHHSNNHTMIEFDRTWSLDGFHDHLQIDHSFM